MDKQLPNNYSLVEERVVAGREEGSKFSIKMRSTSWWERGLQQERRVSKQLAVI